MNNSKEYSKFVNNRPKDATPTASVGSDSKRSKNPEIQVSKRRAAAIENSLISKIQVSKSRSKRPRISVIASSFKSTKVAWPIAQNFKISFKIVGYLQLLNFSD